MARNKGKSTAAAGAPLVNDGSAPSTYGWEVEGVKEIVVDVISDPEDNQVSRSDIPSFNRFNGILVTIKSSGKTYRYNNDSQEDEEWNNPSNWSESSSVSGSISSDIVAFGVSEGIKKDDDFTIPAGTSTEDALRMLLENKDKPTAPELVMYVWNPNAQNYINQNLTVEVGTNLDAGIDLCYYHNDGGEVDINYINANTVVEVNGEVTPVTFIEVPNDDCFECFCDIPSVGNISKETVTFTVKFKHPEGPVIDEPTKKGQILEGTIIKSRSITGDYYVFYGPILSEPDSSNTIRGLTKTFSRNFNMNSGTTYSKFIIAYKSGSLSVTDTTSSNANITPSFSNIDYNIVKDANEEDVIYIIKMMSNIQPYQSNHIFNIKL
jgi:hypothetical protein